MLRILQERKIAFRFKGRCVLRSGKSAGYPDSRGFSLLELMIVVAVIAILIGAAGLELNTFNQTYPIRNNADSIANMVSLARMRAASSFSREEISCSNVTNQCTLKNKPYNGTWAADSNKETVNLSSQVSFGTPTAVTTGAGGQAGVSPTQGSQAQTISYVMVFNSRGFPINDSTGAAVTDYAFYLAGPNSTGMAITVDGSGKSYVYIWTGTAWLLATS